MFANKNVQWSLVVFVCAEGMMPMNVHVVEPYCKEAGCVCADADCQPDTGKPSKCAVEMMLLDMKAPPTSPPVSGAQYYDFTMMMYGDVFCEFTRGERLLPNA